MKIKTGDTVRLLAGKDRGKIAKVIQVFKKENKVVVEGMNLTKKHLRGNNQQKGKTIEFPAPVHMSNVALVAKDGKTAGRVGFDTSAKGDKARIVRQAGKTHDAQ